MITCNMIDRFFLYISIEINNLQLAVNQQSEYPTVVRGLVCRVSTVAIFQLPPLRTYWRIVLCVDIISRIGLKTLI